MFTTIVPMIADFFGCFFVWFFLRTTNFRFRLTFVAHGNMIAGSLECQLDICTDYNTDMACSSAESNV